MNANTYQIVVEILAKEIKSLQQETLLLKFDNERLKEEIKELRKAGTSND